MAPSHHDGGCTPSVATFHRAWCNDNTVTAFKNDIAGRVPCGILWASTYASHSPTVVRGYRDGTTQYSTNTSKCYL